MELNDFAIIHDRLYSPRIKIYLPETDGLEDKKLERILKHYNLKLLSKRTYTISKKRREPLLDALKSLYSGVWEERQYPYYRRPDGSIPCHEDCRNAAGSECVCPCGGQFHGFGNDGYDWLKNIGKIVIEGDVQTVTRWHNGWDELMKTYLTGIDEPTV